MYIKHTITCGEGAVVIDSHINPFSDFIQAFGNYRRPLVTPSQWALKAFTIASRIMPTWPRTSSGPTVFTPGLQNNFSRHCSKLSSPPRSFDVFTSLFSSLPGLQSSRLSYTTAQIWPYNLHSLLCMCFDHIVIMCSVLTALLLTLSFRVGTVLGFVISYRTTASFERYNEGRRLWSQIILASRQLARAIWFHVPGATFHTLKGIDCLTNFHPNRTPSCNKGRRRKNRRWAASTSADWEKDGPEPDWGVCVCGDPRTLESVHTDYIIFVLASPSSIISVARRELTTLIYTTSWSSSHPTNCLTRQHRQSRHFRSMHQVRSIVVRKEQKLTPGFCISGTCQRRILWRSGKRG